MENKKTVIINKADDDEEEMRAIRCRLYAKRISSESRDIPPTSEKGIVKIFGPFRVYRDMIFMNKEDKPN
jgi:hypothetical protein